MKQIIITAFIVVLIAIIAVYSVYTTEIVPSKKYEEAIALMDEGKTDEAYKILTEIKRYKNSLEVAEDIFIENNLEKLASAEVGDCITFGRYEQDNDLENGREEIEWIVIEKHEDHIFVLSKYALDCLEFDTAFTSDELTWENSSLRRWLNRTFYTDALDPVEQRMILQTDNGKDVTDNVFLLSREEIETIDHFNRTCAATEYAKSMGVYATDSRPDYPEINVENACNWWTRTIGQGSRTVVCIDYEHGSAGSYGSPANDSNKAVRPAMKISIVKPQ